MADKAVCVLSGACPQLSCLSFRTSKGEWERSRDLQTRVLRAFLLHDAPYGRCSHREVAALPYRDHHFPTSLSGLFQKPKKFRDTPGRHSYVQF